MVRIATAIRSRCALAKLSAFAAVALLAGATQADVISADYDAVAAELRGVFDFERFEVLPEPGASYDGLILGPALAIGERFAGQILSDSDGFDSVTTGDLAGLALIAGAQSENMAIAFHAGFGSNALFPLGPAGFDDIGGRGEGMLALRYVADQPAVGFKVHSDYPDPLGTRPAPGRVTILFFDRSGTMIGAQSVALSTGVTKLAFRALEGGIAGVVIMNDDPGGIALDDILFALDDVTG